MSMIKSSGAYSVQSNLEALKQATPATEPCSSKPADALMPRTLSSQATKGLNAKETLGSEQEKKLATLAKLAIRSGALQIVAGQSLNDATQFRIEANNNVLTIEAKLNERSEYDVLSVDLKEHAKANVSMTLPALPQPALLRLPMELKLHIASYTKDDKGLNLSLRGVNRHMKVVADDQTSPAQLFLMRNGKSLSAAGYQRFEMNQLAERTVDQQTFVLKNARDLHVQGYTSGWQINDLAARPPAEGEFVLKHAKKLHAAGYRDGMEINTLAKESATRQQFVLDNAKKLHAAGYKGYSMNRLATCSATEQKFVLDHAQYLHANGYTDGFQITNLAAMLPDQRAFILAHAHQLHAAGYPDGVAMNELALQPAAERQEALDKALRL